MPPFDEAAWRKEIEAYRREKDVFFRTSPHSPLAPGLRAAFRGLSYYPPDPAYRLEIRPEPPASAAPVTVATSTGETREYEPAARLPFTVGGVRAALVAYWQGGDWFVPFKDATSGRETYGAGRYLEVHAAQAGAPLLVDFNLAYNPFCAYSEDFSCPFPPFDNWLEVAIPAGEKTFE